MNCTKKNCSCVHSIHEQLIIYQLWMKEWKDEFKNMKELDENSTMCLNSKTRYDELVDLWDFPIMPDCK